MLVYMQAGSPISQRWKLLDGLLNEHQRRALAATEVIVFGRGGVAHVVAATGLARNTVVAGMQELDSTANEFIEVSLPAPTGVGRTSNPMFIDRDSPIAAESTPFGALKT